MHGSVSFRSGWSRAVVFGYSFEAQRLLSVWLACSGWAACTVFMGSEMQSQLQASGFTLLGWIQGAISATLTAIRVERTTVNWPLQRGFRGWAFYFLTHTISLRLKGWAFMFKLTSVIPQLRDWWRSWHSWEPASVVSRWGCLFLLNLCAFPWLYREGAHKEFQKENPFCLVGLHLILNSAVGNSRSQYKWVSWHSLLHCVVSVWFLCSTFPELWGW